MGAGWCFFINGFSFLAVIGMLCCAPLALIGLFMGISILSDIRRARVSAPQASGKAIAAIVLSALVFGAACVHRILSRVRDDLEPPLCGTGRGEI